MHCQSVASSEVELQLGPSGGTSTVAISPASTTDSRKGIDGAKMLRDDQLIEEIKQLIAEMPKRTSLFLASDGRTGYQSDSRLLHNSLPSSAQLTKSTTLEIKSNSEHRPIDASSFLPDHPNISINEDYSPARDSTASKLLSLAFLGSQFEDDATISFSSPATDSFKILCEDLLAANGLAWDIKLSLST